MVTLWVLHWLDSSSSSSQAVVGWSGIITLPPLFRNFAVCDSCSANTGWWRCYPHCGGAALSKFHHSNLIFKWVNFFLHSFICVLPVSITNSRRKKTFFSSSNVLSLVGKSLSCSLQRSSMRRKFQLKFAQNSFLNFKRLDWWIFTHCREVRFILGLWGNMKQRYSHSVLIETSIQYDYINYHLAPGKDYWLCSDIFAFKMNNTLSVIKGLQESLQNLQCRSTVWIPNPLLKYQYYSHMSTLRWLLSQLENLTLLIEERGQKVDAQSSWAVPSDWK